jgi:pre-60S factor REI1
MLFLSFLCALEFLVDLEGLLGYSQEKIKLGHYCLYCEKIFPTWQGCQKHMIDKAHTKLRYDDGSGEELDIFYNFQTDNDRFLGTTDENEMHDGDEEDGWEDVPEEEGDDEEEMYNGYQREIARFGLDVTPLGELIFPDGRIVGHRALRKYYKQRARQASTKPSVVAAKQAAGDRMYEGRVVNIGPVVSPDPTGGAGKGVLVRMKDGVAGFSALSLYRYRAVVRKQRRQDDMCKRSKYRQSMPMNKMDKKANNLMNGVSVTHAKR